MGKASRKGKARKAAAGESAGPATERPSSRMPQSNIPEMMRMQEAMLSSQWPKAVAIAESAAATDLRLAVNGGELVYSGRPGVTADMHRASKIYLAAENRDIVAALHTTDLSFFQGAEGYLTNLDEITTSDRVPSEIRAKAVQKMRALRKSLKQLCSPGALYGRVVTGFSVALSYYDESHSHADGTKEADELRAKAMKGYRQVMEAAELLMAARALSAMEEPVVSRLVGYAKTNLAALQQVPTPETLEMAWEAMCAPRSAPSQSSVQQTSELAAAASLQAAMGLSESNASGFLFSETNTGPSQRPRRSRMTPKICGNQSCLSMKNLKSCGCGFLQYCGKLCQKEDRARHKPQCKGEEAALPSLQEPHAGCTVQIQNLSKAPQYNGLRGEVTGTKVDDRWPVATPSGAVKLFKENNIIVATGAFSEDPGVALVEAQGLSLRPMTVMVLLKGRERFCDTVGTSPLQMFEEIWADWDPAERQSFLNQVVDSTLAEIGQHDGPPPEAMYVVATSELREAAHLTEEPAIFIDCLHRMLRGSELNYTRYREALALGSPAPFKIDQLVGHTNKAKLELCMLLDFARYFQSFFVWNLHACLEENGELTL